MKIVFRRLDGSTVQFTAIAIECSRGDFIIATTTGISTASVDAVGWWKVNGISNDLFSGWSIQGG